MARACLHSGQRGKVLAALSNAIYLLTDTNELFWIVPDNAPRHRRSLKISSPLSGPKAGSPFNVEDHRLTIDPGFFYDMDKASLWHAPQISRKNTAEITDHAISLEPYRTRTHLISFTLLKDLASGYAIAPLHRILNRLLSGESLESIYPSVSQLTQVGHSTGWDWLAGLLTGLLITYRSNYLTSSFQTIQSVEA